MNKRKEKFYEFKEYYIKSSNLKNEIIPIIKEKILKNFYEKDGVLYISKEDYIFLLKYSIYWYKDFLYVIDKEIIKKSKYLKRICCNMDMLFFFKPFPFINENIKEISLEFDKFAYTYLIKKENSDYFNIGQNENINYENKDNLYFIQNELLKGKKLKDIETYKKDSFFTIDFWLFRGWNEEESKKKISDIQKKLSIKCKKKKKNNPEIYNKSDTTKIEYWLSKGYSLDDAKIKLKERQCTFSKKKCIEKYGLEEGLKKLKERNKKWQDSLKGREDYVEY